MLNEMQEQIKDEAFRCNIHRRPGNERL